MIAARPPALPARLRAAACWAVLGGGIITLALVFACWLL